MTSFLLLLVLFAGYQLLNGWFKDHPVVPDSPASLVDAR